MNLVVQLQKLGVTLVRILPLKISDKIATVLGLIFCYLSKKKRSYIQKNLQYIFADTEIAPRHLNYYLKRTFINFARMTVDFFRLGSIATQELVSSVELIGGENLNKALERKTGCVLMTLHLGNWDYAGSYLAALGIPMSALVEATNHEMFVLYTKHRERTGMKTFPLDRAGYAFLQTIKNNRVLAVLADRDILKNGVTVKFFSGKRNIPKGLAEIIINKHIPVVFAYLAFNQPERKARYLGVVEAPIFFNGAVQDFNRFMVNKFEQIIRCYPDQWLVFHPEWLE